MTGWRSLAWIGLAIACTGGCGSPARPRVETAGAAAATYIRPGYKPDISRTLLAIAPLPMATPAARQFEIGLDRAFGETQFLHLRNPSTASRNRLNADRQLVLRMERIHSLGGELGLDSILKPHELENLRQVFQLCDYLFVPGKIDMESRSGKTRAHMTIRVFDLEAGALLLRDTFDVQVDGTGEAGERRAVIELALLASRSFTSHLVP